MRPSLSWVTLSNGLGAGWLLAFGSVILTSLALPIEQLLSVVWVLGFGVAAAIAAYARRSGIAVS